MCCFEYKEDALKFYDELKLRLEKFGLQISEEKSKIIRFSKEDSTDNEDDENSTFNFLGFTHYCGKSKKGKFRVKRRTSKSKFRAKLQKAKKWLFENMHEPVKDTIARLNIKLLGHYRYYGITDNFDMLSIFRREVIKLYVKTLQRRSQKKKFTWEKWDKIMKYCPIVRPKIYVNIYR